jgi:hypothetical protein
MNKFLEFSNKLIDENREKLPSVAAVLTFLYEYRYLTKEKKPMKPAGWLMCLTAAGLSYGITTLMLTNIEDIEQINREDPDLKKLIKK